MRVIPRKARGKQTLSLFENPTFTKELPTFEVRAKVSGFEVSQLRVAQCFQSMSLRLGECDSRHFLASPPSFFLHFSPFPSKLFFFLPTAAAVTVKTKEQEEGAERGQRGKLTTEEGGGRFLERREE